MSKAGKPPLDRMKLPPVFLDEPDYRWVNDDKQLI